MAGYSRTPLVKKLGIKPGFSLLVINPPSDYWDLLGELPAEIQLRKKNAKDLDFIHYFETRSDRLKKSVIEIESKLHRNGMLWVSWPKGTSSIETDLNREIVRDTVLKTRLVDIKVAAIDEDWSGLKFVIRKELR